MKISELIKELNDTMERIGDTEVIVEVDNYGDASIDYIYEMGDPIKTYIYVK